ncbi:MAG: ComEC/Rec2 family competence protein [Nitratireductor sp.]
MWQARATRFQPFPRETWTIALNRFRREFANRIRVSLPGDEGAAAIALITGDRSAIRPKSRKACASPALLTYWQFPGCTWRWSADRCCSATLCSGLPWFPALALHYTIRKWAACRLAFGFAYLVISGASVATQRAWLMIAIMLAATLADRRALTIRNVALAATIILCLSPEALLEPGFQMSLRQPPPLLQPTKP